MGLRARAGVCHSPDLLRTVDRVRAGPLRRIPGTSPETVRRHPDTARRDRRRRIRIRSRTVRDPADQPCPRALSHRQRRHVVRAVHVRVRAGAMDRPVGLAPDVGGGTGRGIPLLPPDRAPDGGPGPPVGPGAVRGVQPAVRAGAVPAHAVVGAPRDGPARPLRVVPPATAATGRTGAAAGTARPGLPGGARAPRAVPAGARGERAAAARARCRRARRAPRDGASVPPPRRAQLPLRLRRRVDRAVAGRNDFRTPRRRRRAGDGRTRGRHDDATGR